MFLYYIILHGYMMVIKSKANRRKRIFTRRQRRHAKTIKGGMPLARRVANRRPDDEVAAAAAGRVAAEIAIDVAAAAREAAAAAEAAAEAARAARAGNPGENSHGTGILYFGNDYYEGQIHNGKLHGVGVVTIRRAGGNHVYAGEWKNSHQTGRGKYTYPNGDVYLGDFIEDEASGHGVYHHSLQDSFHKGEFKNDVMHGMGIYETRDGTKYESGRFINDKFAYGHLKVDRPHHSVYEGDYNKNKKFNRKGRLVYANGDVYEGQLKDDTKYGLGKLTITNGIVQEGTWMGDKMYGKITYPDGTVVEGDFMNGLLLTPNHEAILSGDETD